MNHDIFISYSSKQKTIADGVCHYLEEKGYRCWMSPRDIPSGSEYGDLIDNAIVVCKVVVLVFSEPASVSKWVKGEINVAFSENKTIIPFRVDDTRIIGGFRVMLNQMHWIDAFPYYADKLPDLLKSISGILGKKEEVSANNVVTEESVEGVFSVSPKEKVRFSPGNLQYKASAKTWRFAERQFDFIGEKNTNISPENEGWIDLFGWGTGNEPTKCSERNGDYKTFNDWGKNCWFSLSAAQWAYLLNRRRVASDVRFAKARVAGVNGLVLLPDNWSVGNYIFAKPNKSDADYIENIVTDTDWNSRIQSNGAVFLPAAGFREGTKVARVGLEGYYWSASENSFGRADCMFFTEKSVDPSDGAGRANGYSVRLVRIGEI